MGRTSFENYGDNVIEGEATVKVTAGISEASS
jgi:hypothetical protein